jgi:23S rRNA (cytidine1920-2'-O)/16S rRNA (cytidine1409-2'-O)-methyltransferase
VRRGLAKSRVEARSLIESGRVLVGGTIAIKAARLVAAAEPLVVEGPPARYVGRGGEKLEHALTTFGIDVTDWLALDAGASTGGFTDCLLQRGARHVVAVDVGHGQLHERLRADERVTNVERTNIRSITVAVTGGPVDIVVADLSFISLTMVIGALRGVCQPGAPMVLLVKPQFEAGRVEVSRGRGVITDPTIWDRVQAEITDALVAERCEVVAWTVSPITGAEGNREFLVHARAPEVAH